MAEQHTPTPWRYGLIETDEGREFSLYSIDPSTDPDGKLADYGGAILESGCMVAESDDEADANARLIVRAVNAHAGLVAACEAIMDYWRDTGFAECEPGCTCIVDQLRAALDKAKS